MCTLMNLQGCSLTYMLSNDEPKRDGELVGLFFSFFAFDLFRLDNSPGRTELNEREGILKKIYPQRTLRVQTFELESWTAQKIF